MPEIRNVAKERLEAGELAIGVSLRMARTVEIAKAMRAVGFDFLFIDMEHNSMYSRRRVSILSIYINFRRSLARSGS